MTCTSCSAEIADKAIVCYRCGQPTSAPAGARGKAPSPVGRGRLVALFVGLVALAGLLLFTYLRRSL